MILEKKRQCKKCGEAKLFSLFTKPEHEDFKKCWSLDNLQQMWAKENMIKGANLEKPFQPSLLM